MSTDAGGSPPLVMGRAAVWVPVPTARELAIRDALAKLAPARATRPCADLFPSDRAPADREPAAPGVGRRRPGEVSSTYSGCHRLGS